MAARRLLSALGYDESPNFLQGDNLRYAPENGSTFRRAAVTCGLQGVYVLRGAAPGDTPDVPVVYVCRAESEDDARAIHRRVWNQNIVPFLIVHTDTKVRLYAGFDYATPSRAGTEAGLLREGALRDIANVLAAFNARAIDDGSVWKEWGAQVTPEKRVDWRLLDNLRQLESWLRSNGLEDRSLAHTLIGKYVYLHYLRARNILSDRKFADWDLKEEVFSRHAKLKAFRDLVDRLDEWLNGAIFPVSDSELDSIRAEHLRRVAGAFAGDTMDGQLHLDFDAYDFSHIPIETISVIYEQFLHAAEGTNKRSVGRERGAYYTPMPVVSYILSQLNRRRPLQAGTRILDASCGSGAFLVHCYRMLIEQHLCNSNGKRPRPTELRDLLVRHIVGIDSDRDACQVAELSLILTLLDYVEPPDLSNTNFKLPVLRNRNIFHGDAFDDDAPLFDNVGPQAYQWIVGNPPWKELKKHSIAKTDAAVWDWMQRHKGVFPTGGNQVAEAFAWRVRQFADRDGVIGLLLPAMTLFKNESRGFRQAFFRENTVWHVANFANLAEVLFAGRSRVPAAAFCYSPISPDAETSYPDHITVYSPLVANQEATRPAHARKRQESWSLVVNASEVRDISYRKALTGDLLPWKVVAWGSAWDLRLVKKLRESDFQTVRDLESCGRLRIAQGLELGGSSGRSAERPLEQRPELVGKKRLIMRPLKQRQHIYGFPDEALEDIHKDGSFVPEGRFNNAFAVCQPPHIVLNAGRTFAVYTDDFVVVPHPHIGIAASIRDAALLKALALYLSCDFVRYYEFFISPQTGVKREAAALLALRSLPVPSALARGADVQRWCALYDALDAATRGASCHDSSRSNLNALLKRVNDLASRSLGLDSREQSLVDDLVHVRLALVDGKVGRAAVRRPEEGELREYAQALCADIDDFLNEDRDVRHAIDVWYGDDFGIVRVGMRTGGGGESIRVQQLSPQSDQEVREICEHLRTRYSQWLYFNRNLTVYENENAYLFKPLQLVHWTRSQALVDAGEVIAETLTPTGA
jgi:methylase of polypeptide subunit release factors